jgi:hypothetical protein
LNHAGELSRHLVMQGCVKWQRRPPNPSLPERAQVRGRAATRARRVARQPDPPRTRGASNEA